MVSVQQELIDNLFARLVAMQTMQEVLNHKVSRMEAKLTQLMLFEGMQTDGRKPIKDTNHVE